MKKLLAVTLTLMLFGAGYVLAGGPTARVSRENLFRVASVAALRMQELAAVSQAERSQVPVHPELAAAADSDSVVAVGINRLLNLVGSQVVAQGDSSAVFTINRTQYEQLLAVLTDEIGMYERLLHAPGISEENADFFRGRLVAFRELAAQAAGELSTQ